MKDRRQDHSQILEEIKSIHKTIKVVSADVGVLKIDVGGLKTDMGSVKGDVGEVKITVANLQPVSSLVTMVNSGGMFAKWATKNVTPWALLVGFVLAIIKFLK